MTYFSIKKEHISRSIFLTFSLLSLIIPDHSLCMSQPKKEKNEHPLDMPRRIARRIRAELESTHLPPPLVDLTCQYYGDSYLIATIDMSDENLRKYTKDEFYMDAIHSIVKVEVLPHMLREDQQYLRLLLTNNNSILLSIPEGTCQSAAPNGSFTQSLMKPDWDQTRTLTYLVSPSLIKSHDSNNIYTATVLDADRDETIAAMVKIRSLKSPLPLCRWYTDDRRYTQRDWIEGRDRRRTKVAVRLDLPGLLGKMENS